MTTTPQGIGWWADEVQLMMLQDSTLTVREAMEMMTLELTCGVDLYRTQTTYGQPLMVGGLEVVRIICPHDDMQRWLTQVQQEGVCRCPKHTETALEEGLKRYASVQIVKRHPNARSLEGRWEFKYFRGKQPTLGPRHGSIEFSLMQKGQELSG